MKTSEEIKRILKNCFALVDQPGSPCGSFPYANEYYFCKTEMARDIIECIKGLEERISLMLIQMQGDCGCCKHVTVGIDTEPCASCVYTDHAAWEYGGLPVAMSEKNTRACATCRHHIPIGAQIHYHCVGCIQGGACTKWEDAGGEEHETD